MPVSHHDPCLLEQKGHKFEDYRMCHQCQSSKKEQVAFCKKCGTKRFCSDCIKTW
jgi:hypothetical protein